MNRVICLLSLRESAIWIFPLLCFLFAWVLLSTAPLRYYDPALTLFGVILGGLLAFRIFRDSPGVRPFLFSRAFSPSRLFTVRWLFGMGVLASVWLVVAILIGLGIRQSVQTSLFVNGWYPMIRFMELQCLFGFITASLLFYQGTAFFLTLYYFEGRRRFKGWTRVGRILLTVFSSLYVILGAVGLGAVLITTGFYDNFDNTLHPLTLSYGTVPTLVVVFAVPALVQTLLVPFAGRYCYKNQEIES